MRFVTYFKLNICCTTGSRQSTPGDIDERVNGGRDRRFGGGGRGRGDRGASSGPFRRGGGEGRGRRNNDQDSRRRGGREDDSSFEDGSPSENQYVDICIIII